MKEELVMLELKVSQTNETVEEFKACSASMELAITTAINAKIATIKEEVISSIIGFLEKSTSSVEFGARRTSEDLMVGVGMTKNQGNFYRSVQIQDN